ncbi:MAG: hypothetical protein V1933_08015 [Candidatus Omnitrophota bacterium]
METITAKTIDEANQYPSVFNQTPTVPPKGWLGNLQDLVSMGLDVYKTVKTPKSTQPVQTTISPIIYKTTPLMPSTVTPAGVTQGVLPNNAIYLNSQTSPATPATLAQPADYSKFILIGLVAVLGIFIFKSLNK